jgi:hypothetical protein
MDSGRLRAACALVAVPALVLAGPVAAVLASHPSTSLPTKTLAEQTLSVHLDAPPPGVDVRTPVATGVLLRAAGLSGLASGARLRAAVTPVTTPPGTPTTLGLATHVPPGCTGSGTDGDRVQVAYVTAVGLTDRYAAVLPALESYVADVDDVMALSSAETGGGRRVRWVTDASCVPVIAHVVLPAGSLGSASDGDGGFGATVTAMHNAGYGAAGRKYLMFAEANNLCGIAQVYPDSTKASNNNDGRFPMYARVDNACWTSSYHSVAAHELMHTLGSVQSDTPHPSAAGHCTDESDVMCYVDGPGVVTHNVCPPSHEQLYDCNHDDYFSTSPPVGNYLRTHWNTADSPFLDVVPVLGAPLALTVAGPARAAYSASYPFAVSGAAPSGATYAWSVNPTTCTVTPSGPTATARCRGWGSKSVTVTVYRTAGGSTTFGSATVALTYAVTPPAVHHNPAW